MYKIYLYCYQQMARLLDDWHNASNNLIDKKEVINRNFGFLYQKNLENMSDFCIFSLENCFFFSQLSLAYETNASATILNIFAYSPF